jgi:hypothetical protein
MDGPAVIFEPPVEAWFTASERPAEEALRRVTAIILGADRRMTVNPKYGTLQFAYRADMAGFVQHKAKHVSLMFNRGGAIPGAFPNLEGEGRGARYLRFTDVADVAAKADDLRRIVVAWCDLMDRT